jgi:UDP-glucose 6-dehydrogenase
VNFAENGFNVISVSRTRDKVSAINQGSCYLKGAADSALARAACLRRRAASPHTENKCAKNLDFFCCAQLRSTAPSEAANTDPDDEIESNLVG